MVLDRTTNGLIMTADMFVIMAHYPLDPLLLWETYYDIALLLTHLFGYLSAGVVFLTIVPIKYVNPITISSTTFQTQKLESELLAQRNRWSRHTYLIVHPHFWLISYKTPK